MHAPLAAALLCRDQFADVLAVAVRRSQLCQGGSGDGRIESHRRPYIVSPQRIFLQPERRRIANGRYLDVGDRNPLLRSKLRVPEPSASLRQATLWTGIQYQRLQAGAVARSSSPSHCIACSRLLPHISSDGCKPPQNAGRSGWPKMRHRLFSPSCTHLTPAGFPFGMPGIGLVIEGAVQQAPQLSRQFMPSHFFG